MYPTLYRHTCAHTQTHGKAEIGIHPLKFKDDTFSLSQMFLDHPMSPIPTCIGRFKKVVENRSKRASFDVNIF